MQALFGGDLVPSHWCHVVDIPFAALLSIAQASKCLTVRGDVGPLEGDFLFLFWQGQDLTESANGVSLKLLDGPTEDVVLDVCPWAFSKLRHRSVFGRRGRRGLKATLGRRPVVE